MKSSLPKYLSFGTLALLAVVLILSTIAGKYYGFSFAVENIYSTGWFVILWGIMSLSGIWYIFKTPVKKILATLFLHLAFVVVLAGALVTYLTAERGTLFMCKESVPASMFMKNDGSTAKFPFRLSLLDCGVVPGEESDAPHDYFAKLFVQQGEGDQEVAKLSMNNIYNSNGYRLYISEVSGDCVTLLVSRDSRGTCITYTGYLLTVLAFILLFIARNTQRASLTRKTEKKNSDKADVPHRTKIVALSLLMCTLITCMGVWRASKTGVFPVTNGTEVLMFIAWGAFLSVGLLRKNKHMMLGAFGLAVLCVVIALSSGVTQTGDVQPVLRTPLLPLHVVSIVVSYFFIALLAVNASVALFIYRFKGDYERMESMALRGRQMLYISTFFLVVGIFLGAVWANISWGRYWGWDPKEVWALITLIICSLGFHTRSLPFMARPLIFHCFCIVAFIAVLFTYFGVNFLLGGLHAYA